MPRRTSVEKLVERLRREGWQVPERYEFKRLQPGRWGRSAGAWSWQITANGGYQLGSPDNVAQCLKSSGLASGPHETIYA
jgi:hypothetical protein